MKPLASTITKILFLAALLAPGLPAPLLASDETAGTVVAARGPVTASRATGPERTLATKATFFVDDTVKTGAAARAQLMFRDNTVISLGAATVMKIAEYSWDAAKKVGAVTTRVEEGTFRVLGGLITKQNPDKFKTQTPAATIGIRGSMYAGSVHNRELKVVFQGGKGIYVENELGRVEIDTPGFGTVVSPGLAPEPPHRFTEAELTRLFDELRRDEQETAPWITANTLSGSGRGGRSSDSGGGEPDTALESTVDTPLTVDINAMTDGGEFGGVVTPPSHGQLVDNGDGTFSYIPDEGWSGVDSFSYRTTDPSGQSVTETVIITVSPVIAGNGPTATFPAGPAAIDPAADALAGANGAAATASQDQSATQAAAAAATPATGRFMSVVTGNLDRTIQYTLLDSTAMTTSGAIIGITLNGGAVLPEYANSAYDSLLAPYSQMSADSDIVLVDAPASLVYTAPAITDDVARWNYADNLNEFYYAWTSGLTGTALDYDYQALVVGGTPTLHANLPTAGISLYEGTELFRYYDAAGGDILFYSTDSLYQTLSLNWHNGKFIGFDDRYNIIYGNISGNQLTSVKVFNPLTIGTIDHGAGSFGTIYGSVAQGLGLGYAGTSLDPVTGTQAADWSSLSALTLSATDINNGTGAATFSGFVVGPITPVGADIGSDPLFGILGVDISRDPGTGAGNVSGFLTAADSTDTHRIDNMSIGGSYGSAYVTDSLFLAEAGCAGDCIDGTGSLTPGENLLYTDFFSTTGSPYLSWGAWNVYFNDPATTEPMMVSATASYWVAGEKTPESILSGLIGRTGLTGSYSGDARVSGTTIDSFGPIFSANGTALVNVNFETGTADGGIAFNKPNDVDFDDILPPVDVNLAFSGATVTANGFFGTISGLVDNDPLPPVGPTGATALVSGPINGAFYGPAAEAVAGAFSASGGNDYYWGVFAGSK